MAIGEHVEREPITIEGLGQSPSGVQGQSPWSVRESGEQSPLKLKTF